MQTYNKWEVLNAMNIVLRTTVHNAKKFLAFVWVS
jgi:hypothetical protein